MAQNVNNRHRTPLLESVRSFHKYRDHLSANIHNNYPVFIPIPTQDLILTLQIANMKTAALALLIIFTVAGVALAATVIFCVLRSVYSKKAISNNDPEQAVVHTTGVPQPSMRGGKGGGGNGRGGEEPEYLWCCCFKIRE